MIPRGDVLLIAGLSGSGEGGLVVLDGKGVDKWDEVHTNSLIHRDETIIRGLTPISSTTPGCLVYYGRDDFDRLTMIDELLDPHALSWDGDRIVATSTFLNAILWIDSTGRVVRRWRAPGEIDSWHINAVIPREGDLLVCAFGNLRRYREWLESGPTGLVFGLKTGNLITGLSSPHNPCFIDGHWLVCNSADGEVLRIDNRGMEITARVQLEGWTRGVVATEDLVFIGESPHRHREVSSMATIAVLDRQELRLLDRIDVPCSEIGDLAIVPARLARGVARGSAALAETLSDPRVPARVGVPQPADHLAPTDIRVSFQAVIPREIPAGATMLLECRLFNHGPPLAGGWRQPRLRVGSRWLQDGNQTDLGERTPLPRPVGTGDSLVFLVVLRAPPGEGSYDLDVGLVREHDWWLEDLIPGSSARGRVWVAGKAESLPSAPPSPIIGSGRSHPPLEERTGSSTSVR